MPKHHGNAPRRRVRKRGVFGHGGHGPPRAGPPRSRTRRIADETSFERQCVLYPSPALKRLPSLATAAPRRRPAGTALNLRTDDALIAFWATRPEDLPLKAFVFLVALSEWLSHTGRDVASVDEIIALRADFDCIATRLVGLGLITRAQWRAKTGEPPS